MTEENIAFRLKFLLQKLGATSSSFADECGISRATFSQLLTGRNKKISDVLIGQIHAAYPSLSILWLLFNEGPMWIGQPENISSESSENIGEGTTDHGESTTGTGGYVPGNGDLTNSNGLMTAGKSEISGRSGSSSSNSSEMTSENWRNPGNGQEPGNYSKENPLKYPENGNQDVESEGVNICNKIPEFLGQIEKTRVKTRKVVQVTIYYDDSTFETLFPRVHGERIKE